MGNDGCIGGGGRKLYLHAGHTAGHGPLPLSSADRIAVWGVWHYPVALLHIPWGVRTGMGL